MRRFAALVALAYVSFLSNIGHAQTGLQTPVLETVISGISSSWAGECGPNAINNTSTVSRRNYYNSVGLVTGSGTWSVTINYSDVSCTAGPWTSFGSAATITQASNPAIASGNGYHAYIQIAITGNAVVTYTAMRTPFLANSAGGTVTFPITVGQGGTGTSTPGLIQGTNVTITGAWPNQTINASGGSSPVTSVFGQTGAIANLSGDCNTSGSSVTNCTKTGGVLFAPSATIDATIANNITSGTLPFARLPAINLASSGAGGVTGILPVANGGTGTVSPGLVQGSNIMITGSWPNQTISTAGAGGLTSVGVTFAGGLINGSGSPLTSNGTIAFTLAGTSGGIPYFNSGTTWLSSGVLGSGQFVLGGGAGGSPSASFSIVPVANGGTGTASPGLIAGANITSITGAWPNQTINAAGGAGGYWSLSGSSISNTNSGSVNVGNTLNVTVPANTTNQGLNILQTIAGNGTLAANEIYVNGDTGNNGTAGSNQALQIQHVFGGSAMTGGRNSLEVTGYLIAPSSTSNTLHDYVASRTWMNALSGDNGTSGTPQGGIWGGNDSALAQTGATFLLGVVGREINWGVMTGASAAINTGLSLVPSQLNSTHGTQIDASINFGGSPGGMTPNFLMFLTDAHGAAPVSSATTILGTDGNAHTIATGIDLSSYTITGNFLKSNGFAVNGSGIGTMAGLTLPSLLSAGCLGTNGSGTVGLGTCGGSPAFSAITSGTATSQNFGIGTGSLLFASGGGTIQLSTGGILTAGFGRGTVDFTGAAATSPVVLATTSSITGSACAQGQMAFSSNATAGANIYGCTATNVWTQEGGSGTPTTVAGGQSVSVSTVGSTATVSAPSAPLPASLYNWTPQLPGGTLTSGTPATITLTPGPIGVSGSLTNYWLYVNNGTGTAEAVHITSGSCTGAGQTSCTVTFTPGNNHSGAWQIGPATAGNREAMNAACATGNGGWVQPAVGTSVIHASLYIPCSGITFQGQSQGSVIQVATNEWSNGANWDFVAFFSKIVDIPDGVSNTVVEDLTIDMNGSSQVNVVAQTYVSIGVSTGASHNIVQRVTGINAQATLASVFGGIYTNASTFNTFRDNTFTGLPGCTTSGGGPGGIFVQGSDNLVENNTISGTCDEGFISNSNGGFRNHFNKNHYTGHSGSTASAYHVEDASESFWDENSCVNSSATVCFNIASSASFAISNTSFTGNVCDTVQTCIGGSGGNTNPITNTTISGNVVMNAVSNGISISQNFQGVTIVGNTVYNAGTGGGSGGIAIVSTATVSPSNVSIIGNVLNHNGPYGIFIIGSGSIGTLSNYVIRGNSMIDTAASPVQTYGLFCQVPGSTLANFQISGNNVYGSTGTISCGAGNFTGGPPIIGPNNTASADNGMTSTGTVVVSALPTCNSAGVTWTRWVSDATTTVAAGIGTVVAGGAGNTVPVACDGANWRIN